MGGFFPRGNGEGGSGNSPARSGTTFTDRRMKTNTVLYPNGARDSSVSLQDNEDYSRPVLRVSGITDIDTA
jgi:cell wall integrity and stress response component